MVQRLCLYWVDNLEIIHIEIMTSRMVVYKQIDVGRSKIEVMKFPLKRGDCFFEIINVSTMQTGKLNSKYGKE